jgi:signal peptidase II
VTATVPAGTVADQGRPRWLIFFGLAATIAILDQLTKAWLVGLLAPGERIEIVGEFVRLVHGQNTGALFGMFRDQAVLFGLVSLGVIALIIWYHGASGRNTLLSVALGLLLGGAIGNMLDRLRRGYVVDFVDLGIGDLRWYTFNVADAAISGAILLFIAIAFLPMITGRGEEGSGAAPRAADGDADHGAADA